MGREVSLLQPLRWWNINGIHLCRLAGFLRQFRPFPSLLHDCYWAVTYTRPVVYAQLVRLAFSMFRAASPRLGCMPSYLNVAISWTSSILMCPWLVLIWPVYPLFMHIQQPQRAWFPTPYGQEETGTTTADLPRPANAYIYIVPGIPPFCLSMRSTFRWQNILLQSCSRRARLHTNWISFLSMAKHTQTATAVHAAAYRLFQRQPAFARECVYKGFETHQRYSFNNTDTNGMPGLGGTRIHISKSRRFWEWVTITTIDGNWSHSLWWYGNIAGQITTQYLWSRGIVRLAIHHGVHD